ncbi:hypothetical protein H5410_011271 [Solanum commersonii]|uniref:Uncharacterized protein n=1 Tax=Solanum commersonii TaxID=4109 RepID=A0A9J6AN47_SOLCO|nr:hypothetical protein H5410_011271 [Solanum commersonii]
MDQVKAIILVIIMNIIFPGVSIALSVVVLHGEVRNSFIDNITVIRSKTVECMSFLLSFFLLLNAGAWFAFAMFLQDPYLIVPNVVGLASGSAQLIIYINV